MLFEKRSAAQVIPARETDRDPEERADDAEGEKADVVHLANAGDERGEGADDRDETRQDHRLTAVLLVERLGVQQVLFVKKARIFTLKNRRAQAPSEPVVH